MASRNRIVGMNDKIWRIFKCFQIEVCACVAEMGGVRKIDSETGS